MHAGGELLLPCKLGLSLDVNGPQIKSRSFLCEQQADQGFDQCEPCAGQHMSGAASRLFGIPGSRRAAPAAAVLMRHSMQLSPSRESPSPRWCLRLEL